MADQKTTAGPDDRSEPGTAAKAKEKGKEMKDKARDKVSDVAAEARHRGEDLVEEGKEKAHEMGDRAAEMARSRAEEQKQRVSTGIRSVADALRRGGQDMPEDSRQYGQFLTGVADRVEGVSRYIEERDVNSITRDARRIARDHSPVFLSGAFTLGMLGARFLKSSGGDAERDQHDALPSTARSGRYAATRRDTGYGRYQPDDLEARDIRDRGIGGTSEIDSTPGLGERPEGGGEVGHA